MSKIVIETTEVLKKRDLGQNCFHLILGTFSKTKSIKPGQFIHIKTINGGGVFFRRAFSIFDINPKENSIEILFKVFGRGTAELSKAQKGDKINVMGPLGNGFTLPSKKITSIIAGGGIGMPPLYFLAKYMIEKGYNSEKIWFFYGGKTKNELMELSKIKKLGINLVISTDDGSYGFKGFVSQAINDNFDGLNGQNILFACGPLGLLKAIDQMALREKMSGQISLEAPMPCGIGICLGCILPLREGGYTRVCREGPVYKIGEVIL